MNKTKITLLFTCIPLFFICLIYLTNKKEGERYDLRDKGLSSAARQQAWGTCWAHGTIAAMESNLLLNKNWSKVENREVDLSEYHMDKYNGFNRSGEAGDYQSGWYSGQNSKFKGSNIDDLKQGLVVHLGGDYRMAAAHLSNSLGAVQEYKTPKINSNNKSHDEFGNNTKEGILFSNNYNYYFPKHIEWLTLEGSKELKRQKIKDAIKKYGAVASAQHIQDKPLSTAKDGLEIHMSKKNENLDHALVLIGWNDDISFDGRQGAWIAKDSDHKNELTGKYIGHFYIMYDDFYAASDTYMGGVSFRDVTLRKASTKIYSHSLHGWRYTTDENFYEVANIYTSKRSEELEAVGIYTIKENSNYIVNIYKGNEIIHSQTGNEVNPGFHYIELSQIIKLKKGDEFKVSLQYENAGYAYDASFAMEVLLGKLPKWGEPVIIHSKASKGESFYRESKGGSWKEFSHYKSKTNKQKSIDHAMNNNTANFSLNAYTVLRK
jgi:C1A family cysteine protease